MTILEKILIVAEEQVADTTRKLTDRLQQEAVEAILGGLDSEAWATYMKNFVDNDNPDQLARLTGKDSTRDDIYMRRARAYLVANAMCGAATEGKLARDLGEGVLDQGIDNVS